MALKPLKRNFNIHLLFFGNIQIFATRYYNFKDLWLEFVKLQEREHK